MNKYYVTKERLAELEEEFQELKSKKRIEVADRLKNAKEFGDLSENSEYTEAKEEQERVERRIFELDEVLKYAVVIPKGGGTDKINVGSEVTVKGANESSVYRIVGSDETKPEEGKISNESPLGRALLGRRVGESISIRTPSGEKTYHITKVQ